MRSHARRHGLTKSATETRFALERGSRPLRNRAGLRVCCPRVSKMADAEKAGVQSLPRPIRSDEVAVIRATFEACTSPSTTVDPAVLRDVEKLMVVSRCGCGCATVRFAPRRGSEPELPLARGRGVTPSGDSVLIFVFGRTYVITELEIAPLNEPMSGGLPTVASILA